VRTHLAGIAEQVAVAAMQGRQRMAALMENEIPEYTKQIRESVNIDFSDVTKKVGTHVSYESDGTLWHKGGVRLDKYQELVDSNGDLSYGKKIFYYKIGKWELPFIQE
jgi:hypothetical protein